MDRPRSTSVRTAFDDRAIGITSDQLREIPRRVAVAGGERKVSAIRGGLLSDRVNVLLTDVGAAERLLHTRI